LYPTCASDIGLPLTVPKLVSARPRKASSMSSWLISPWYWFQSRPVPAVGRALRQGTTRSLRRLEAAIRQHPARV
jgi:hypothetical protein